ncbi:MAG TPA: hypothetical protein IGS52_16665 [Oscillatoriaceae cyanobacterium M33_DOE_052]|nr:hypothetical protein [Oscillatoriaceae cyanobacterium M33_DOE_052]
MDKGVITDWQCKSPLLLLVEVADFYTLRLADRYREYFGIITMSIAIIGDANPPS